MKIFIVLSIVFLIGSFDLGHADQRLICSYVDHAPIINGQIQDPVWQQAEAIITHDKVANLDISLKSVHTNEKVFFLVRFDDPDRSDLHKAWHWDKASDLYQMGPEREDVFVLKWALDKNTDDLSLSSVRPYAADVWFWKANRTDPMGYADDKIQRLSLTKQRNSKKLLSKTGTPMYLTRQGDVGKSAYKSKLFVDYQGDTIPQFQHRKPSGSRADIQAKGQWNNHEWTIEFSRPLKTNNDDDIQFDFDQTFTFGVSRYEIAGRQPDPLLSQSLYGSGDVSENLVLIFDH